MLLAIDIGNTNITAIGFGNNNLIAGSTSGNILRSTDNGSSWDNATSPTTIHLADIIFSE